MPQKANQNRLTKLENEHKLLDEQVKKLYNTTSSERTLKELKVKKLKLKDTISKIKGEGNGKED
jgi:uncharacterized protein YdcH (DUF465 family)|tara:strand:- start:1013 stop:1204 length:192 start_codon:yes stop_codon:yes gene_type:complete